MPESRYWQSPKKQETSRGRRNQCSPAAVPSVRRRSAALHTQPIPRPQVLPRRSRVSLIKQNTCPFHPCARGDRRRAGRPDQRRLDADAEYPLARSPAARARAGGSDPAVPRVRAAGGRRAAAGRPVPAQAPPARLAGGDRADGAAGPARPAQGARLRGDRDHLGGRARAAGGRDGVPRRARSAHAAVGVLARAAARCRRAGDQRRRRLGFRGPSVVE